MVAQQGTDEWFQERKGKWTASNLDSLLVKGKSDSTLGAGAITLCYEKLAERMSSSHREINSKYMEHGNELEPEARQIFENNTGLFVGETGLCIPADEPFNEISGGSPDGVIIDENNNFQNEIIEIKCPHDPVNHLYTLIHKEIPTKSKKKYIAQMQWNMYCTGATKCYFASYDPRITEESKKLVVLEVERDDELIEEIKGRILVAEKYLKELEEKIA